MDTFLPTVSKVTDLSYLIINDREDSFVGPWPHYNNRVYLGQKSVFKLNTNLSLAFMAFWHKGNGPTWGCGGSSCRRRRRQTLTLRALWRRCRFNSRGKHLKKLHSRWWRCVWLTVLIQNANSRPETHTMSRIMCPSLHDTRHSLNPGDHSNTTSQLRVKHKTESEPPLYPYYKTPPNSVQPAEEGMRRSRHDVRDPSAIHDVTTVLWASRIDEAYATRSIGCQAASGGEVAEPRRHNCDAIAMTSC